MKIHEDVLEYARRRIAELEAEDEATLKTATGAFIRGQLFELEKLIAAQVGR